MTESVQCPKCQSAVSVGVDQAGQRVQCPSCLKSFLAPSSLGGQGRSGGTSEDDDWLMLDDSQPSQSPTTPSVTPEAVTDDDVDDVELLHDPTMESDEADNSDPDDLFAGLPDIAPAVPNPIGSTSQPKIDSDDDIDLQLGIFGDTPAQPPAPKTKDTAPAAETIGADESFRVTCQVCGSVVYAKAKQSGQTVKCSDCHSDIRIPKPPRKQTKVAPTAEAETFSFSNNDDNARPADPYMRSAQELLAEAEKDPDEEERDVSLDVPSAVGWFKSVFGIFLDPGVIFHFLGLSLLLALPIAVVVAYPVLIIGLVPIAIIGIALSVTCGFAILNGVANEHERIEDWPTVDPTGWFESVLLVVTATAIAVGPAYLIATLFSAPPKIVIIMVMITIYFTFPVILLSMLDMQSITTPFSPDVGKSFNRKQEDWGAFYFSSGVLFAALFAYCVFGSFTPTSVAIGVVLTVAVIFMYFAMLGRLALAIGEVVELSGLETDSEEQTK